MKKRNKKRIWKFFKMGVGLLFRGIWWVVKNISLGLYYIGSRFVNWGANKIKEKNKIRKIKKQPQYDITSTYDEPAVVNSISGDFKIFNNQLLNDSLILLIFGKRGSGKSALGFRILENIYSKMGRKCFVLGVKSEVLPSWIQTVEAVEDVANGGVVLVDEGAIAFGSRDSMSSKNRELGKLMAIARHKDLTLIFVTQNTGMLDKNVLKLADALLIKEGSLLQLEMERPEIKKFYEKAENAFKILDGERKKYVYVAASDFEGVVEAVLPGFWNSKVSKNQM